MGSVTDRPRVLRVKSERHASGSVLVSVGDSGTGVEPENKERIFEPFFTTKYDGMGMGLMFCRSIIEVHGGRLWVTEHVPQGTILRYTLPDNDDGASPTARGVQCARSNPSSLSSMTDRKKDVKGTGVYGRVNSGCTPIIKKKT